MTVKDPGGGGRVKGQQHQPYADGERRDSEAGPDAAAAEHEDEAMSDEEDEEDVDLEHEEAGPDVEALMMQPPTEDPHGYYSDTSIFENKVRAK